MVGVRKGPYVLVAWVILLWVLVLWHSLGSSRYSASSSDLTLVGSQVASAPQALVVLSTGGGEWEVSGRWAGFGQRNSVRLGTPYGGMMIHKQSCDVKCEFTDDQSRIGAADAVVLEYVAHAHSGKRAKDFPFPPQRSDNSDFPLKVAFSFEPTSLYHSLNSPPFLSKFDMVVNASPDATIPISMICPWVPGRSYLDPPNLAAKQDLVAIYSETKGGRSGFSGYITRLTSELGPVQKYSDVQSSLKTVEDTIEWLSKFYFVIVVDSPVEEDWVSHAWSQTLLAGSVPVYAGAPNILESSPGPGSFVPIQDWHSRSPDSLISFLHSAVEDKTTYARFFQWKRNGLAPSFAKKLDQCTFYAECRICKEVVYRKQRAAGIKSENIDTQ